ncbi:MAG: 50S ribosomal protein L4 [SAR202 cluster bacterium]|nr:50S ribosomal protein L4 [SAR202 cluster bacterium]
MELKVYNNDGQVVGALEASDVVWGQPMHMAVLHQVIIAQQANQRQGTHDTKTRGQVIGSGRKLRPQKHSGRARIGDITAPRMRGGGVAHGPHPRSYRQRLTRRVRRTALRVALSEKLRRKRLFVLDGLKLEGPSTSAVSGLIGSLKLKGQTLLVTEGVDQAVLASARNLKEIAITPANLLNALDAHRATNLVITQAAVKKVDSIWSAPVARPARGGIAPAAPAPVVAPAPAIVEKAVQKARTRTRAATKATVTEKAKAPVRRTRKAGA